MGRRESGGCQWCVPGSFARVFLSSSHSLLVATAYYKPAWANDAWDRHFTGFGRLWITRFPFRIHLTYDDPLPLDPEQRRKQEMHAREVTMEEEAESSKHGFEEQKRSAARADRAQALAMARARARGEPLSDWQGDLEESKGVEGGAARVHRSHKHGGMKTGAKDHRSGRRLLHLCTDSSQSAEMHAIDLRRLVKQNRSPEIQRRARIRDRLIALKDRRIKLPKTLHVPVRCRRLWTPKLLSPCATPSRSK